MERSTTRQAVGRVGETVRLQGWLHQFRALGKVNFLILRDGWGTFQAVVEDAATLEELRALQVESVIELTGVVVAEPHAPGGAELHETRLTVITPVSEPPPLEINKRAITANLDTFLDHAAIGLRHPARRAALRLGGGVIAGFRAALLARDFTEISTPKLLGAASEGGAEVFTLEYFGRPAFLAQSPQLYKQMAVGIFERVFEVGPVFRAEPHATARHLAQYLSLDVEFGFIEDHHDVMALLTEVLREIIAYLGERYGSDIEAAQSESGPRSGASDRRAAGEGAAEALPVVPERIPTIHFRAAQTLLCERHGIECEGEPDLAPEHERLLGAWARETHGSEFLFVTGYPMAKRPFYTHPDPTDPRYSNSFDLLFRGLELVTGGQRLHHHADYLAALAARGMDERPLAEYLEAFRHGMPPHGGFAIGLERFVMQLFGLANVRLATLFPRDRTRLSP